MGHCITTVDSSGGARRGVGTAFFLVLSVIATAQASDRVQWTFDHPSDLIGRVHLEPGQLANGCLSGQTSWDPYVSLRVPAETIDAEKLTWLVVRMYSSDKADVLDVYYESPDHRWCLGGRLPVVKGWATYRLDLTKNHWRETRTGDVSKQWGGPSKRVCSLRIDPGNQADRWVALDHVTLQAAEPGLEEGVTSEPRGTARMLDLELPESVEAGRRISLSARFHVAVPAGLARGTAFIRLCRGNTILRLVEQPVTFSGDRLEVPAELPISAYWYPGPATVECGVYELDIMAESDPPRRELQITSGRVGAVQPPVVELRRQGGDPAIFVDGKPIPGYLYVSHGGLHLDYHREIAQAGVHLYADWFGSSRHSDLGHVAPNRYDYAEFDRYFAAILDVDPDAYFIPHVGLAGPRWWQDAHPEEMCQFEDGSKGPTSFASQLWRREIGEDLRRLIAYLRKAPYADRILGYMFYNGYTAEWQMWGTWQSSRGDYSLPAQQAFRTFLTSRYETDTRLRAAWNDPKVTLATAPMPAWSKRRPWRSARSP